jgi:hypothetical protein
MRVLLFIPLAFLAVVVAVSAPSAARAKASATCEQSGYGYAGHLSSGTAHGVAATVREVTAPQVTAGHVAAWVGVGGVGQGPGGTNEWIQVGLSAFPGSTTKLYYEVAQPNAAPHYTELEADTSTLGSLRLAVLEMAGQPDSWRVWVNGHAVTPPVHLPGSSGRWRPMATAETWHADGSACNHFRFAFTGVKVAAASGGSWRTFVSGRRFLDAGYQLRDRGQGSFEASAL